MASALVLLALLVAGFAVVDYLPTHDGVQHVYSAWVQNHFTDPGTLYVEAWNPNRRVTTYGFGWLFRPLEPLVGWRLAMRIALAVIVCTWALAGIALSRRLHGRLTWSSLLLVPAALQWGLYMGYFNYLAGLALMPVIVLVALRRDRLGLVETGCLTALFAVQALAHMFAGVLTGVIFRAVVLSRTPRLQLPKQLLALATCGAVPLCIALLSIEQATTQFEQPPPLGVWRLLIVPSVSVVGPLWKQIPLLVLAGCGLAFALRRAPDTAARVRRGVGICGAIFAAWLLLGPMDIPGWYMFAPRFAPCVLLLGLALLPDPRPRALPLWRVAIVTFGVAGLLWSAAFHRTLERACSPALDGLAAEYTRSEPFLFVPLRGCFADDGNVRSRVPAAHFLNNYDAIYAMDQGGIARMFAIYPTVHPFMQKSDGGLADIPWFSDAPAYDLGRSEVVGDIFDPAGSPASWLQLSTYVAHSAALWGEVIAYGDEAQRSGIVARGFDELWSNENVFLGRFAGCTYSVALSPDSALDVPIVVDYHWFPLADTERRVTSHAADLLRAPAELPLHPCGPMELRMFADVDRDGELGPTDLRCLGSDADGEFRYLATDDDGVFVCQLVPMQ